MSQKIVEKSHKQAIQCCKLYVCPDQCYHIRYPKKTFFDVLIGIAILGSISAFRLLHQVPLLTKFTTGLANLASVGLIVSGIGLWMWSPIILIAAGICTLIGLACGIYASNGLIQYDAKVFDLNANNFVGAYIAEETQNKIKNHQYNLVPITEEIANNLKQQGCQD